MIKKNLNSLRNVTFLVNVTHDTYNKAMGNYEENYLDKRPQSLCHMCGRCCRVVTTGVPYEELKKMSEDGIEAAVDFLGVFEPYESIDAARAVDSQIVDNIISTLSEDGNYDSSKMTFYCCKYLQEDNLCGNYENRPVLCRHCPSTAWAIVPPGCGFEGWLFWKREEDKEKVRRSKEELIELNLLKSKTANPETLNKIEMVEEKIRRNIDMFKKYGSDNW